MSLSVNGGNGFARRESCQSTPRAILSSFASLGMIEEGLRKPLPFCDWRLVVSLEQ